MFYSHEVLTSRKYGVATVWLVATLGFKSNLKKVSRKAILDVDVQKACETIVTPEAPMALRLQSNLLYGVTRVYAQQCGYVLNDVEAAKNNMRMMSKGMRETALAPEGANMGRADQLVLPDDPNFLPDFDLMAMDLDHFDFEATITNGSQRLTLSPRSSQRTSAPSGSPYDIGGLIIAPSASSFLGGPVGGAGSSGMRGDSGTGSKAELRGFLDDDLGLAIDNDGSLRIDDPPVEAAEASAIKSQHNEMASQSSRMQQGSLARQAAGDVERPNQDGFTMVEDKYMPGVQDHEFPSWRGGDEHEEQVTLEETADAPLRHRAGPKSKVVPLDNTMELRSTELARWSTNYVANMNEAIRHKSTFKVAALAKKNAEYILLGQSLRGPLGMFEGAQLLAALTGISLTAAGQKHARDSDDQAGTARRVRPRREQNSDEIGRGHEEDDGYMVIGDDTIEQGREAPTPLDDRHMSSMMPWNQSASSHRPTGLFSGIAAPTSGSIGAPVQSLGLLSRRGSRLTSASPLMGRGAVCGDTDDPQFAGSLGDIDMDGLDNFELFGPAAEVDTQTAAQSQWQRAALDGESMHFLEFVQAGIEEADQARDAAAAGDEGTEEIQGSITFDTLLNPDSHRRIVAAQALLHVLALGTKNLLAVKQHEAFGPIEMRVLAAAA